MSLDALAMVAVILGFWAGFSIARESESAIGIFGAGILFGLIGTTPGWEFSTPVEAVLWGGSAVLFGTSIVVDRRRKQTREGDTAADEGGTESR